jgi:hypothetical protein
MRAMRWNLLFKAVWQQHKVATICTSLALVLGAAALGTWSSEPAPEERPTRLLLNRVWFDRVPESNRDDVGLWIWLAGGIGIYQQGSAYRASMDIFEFERNGRGLAMSFLHDGAAHNTEFTIEACDELPPFDLCLTLLEAPRGRNRYYSFGATEDMAEHIPWSTRVMAAARAHASQ